MANRINCCVANDNVRKVFNTIFERLKVLAEKPLILIFLPELKCILQIVECSQGSILFERSSASSAEFSHVSSTPKDLSEIVDDFANVGASLTAHKE
jgi:hypothetical protein